METINSCKNNNNKLHIKFEDPDDGPLHPCCPHGPTLLFYRGSETNADSYYSCAAHRKKSSCSFHLLASKYKTEKHPRDKYKLPKPSGLTTKKGITHYCLECNLMLMGNELTNHKTQPKHKHKIIRLDDRLRQDPTKFLLPLDNDAEHAQYFFDTKALEFFGRTLNKLKIGKIVCIGAPRLHGYLRTHYPNIKSFLLDFDKRFLHFYGSTEYAWYNMCNNHFFYETQRKAFLQFLKCNDNEQVLLFTDPPFACRTEPIAESLYRLNRLQNTINKLPYQPLPIFWIFPYYSEHYIQQVMPQMLMSDYKINYTNHESYTDLGNKSRKLGSPVRLYTNVPLNMIYLPIEESYKYCNACERYTASENQHCTMCKTCPSKNGATYRHCQACGICVKPYYVHCYKCRRCTQSGGNQHECEKYSRQQHCWICLQLGHTEHNCDLWQQMAKLHTQLKPFKKKAYQSRIIICLLCGEFGHNERHCKQRSKYLRECKFLNSIELTIK